MSKRGVIITAGGIGNRMKSDLPKQFHPIGGYPILMKTIEAFFEYDQEIDIIVALPNNQKKKWTELIRKYNFSIPHKIVSGGKERFHSVQNALEICKSDFIAVHDAVRPFVNAELIKRCFDALKDCCAVIPVIKPKDSIRIKDGSSSRAVDRKHYYLVQTPQCFISDVLKKAYQQEYRSEFTDDASVVDYFGKEILLIDGLAENFKITTPTDLLTAKALLEH